MTVDEAYSHISRAINDGKAANGYLIVGSPRGQAAELADRILRLLFGDRDLSAHPDVHRLRPEMRSRVISAETMRERIIAPMESTAFQGGWKAGVIVNAECMQKEAANSYLKVLEEPPPRTVFLLLTNRPERLLPTIISRCQRVDLPDARQLALSEPYRSRVLNILADEALSGQVAKSAAAARLCAILAELKGRAEVEVIDELKLESEAGEESGKDEISAMVSARYLEYRQDFLGTLQSWYRDLMALVLAPPSHSSFGAEGDSASPLMNEERRAVLESRSAKLQPHQVFYNVEKIDELAKTLECGVPELGAISLFMDRMFPGVDA